MDAGQQVTREKYDLMYKNRLLYTTHFLERRMLDFFSGRNLNKSINTDEAVVCAAVLLVAEVTGEGSEATENLIVMSEFDVAFNVYESAILNVSVEDKSSECQNEIAVTYNRVVHWKRR
ncbi:Heat shock protein [Echinococcus granulosus]|uniref:Heat shock protein n=1 Tax=Echinococcus granulosus TaxID=6210 RepID=W6U455_ECHGR|nr:Heat shock protein [Echinococcus granulosus]EUB55391.1 Heat shock protein [Echinococcus granulosus]